MQRIHILYGNVVNNSIKVSEAGFWDKINVNNKLRGEKNGLITKTSYPKINGGT